MQAPLAAVSTAADTVTATFQIEKLEPRLEQAWGQADPEPEHPTNTGEAY